MGMAFEEIKWMRHVLIARWADRHKVDNSTAFVSRLTNWPHVCNACLYGVQVTVGMMLMLIWMYYNVWLIAAHVAGALAGNVIFGNLNKEQFEDGDEVPCRCD